MYGTKPKARTGAPAAGNDDVQPGPVAPGNNRGAVKETAVLDAAYMLVAERGLQQTTIDAIAAESKVSKMTIYKRWPNRAAVILAAFLREGERSVPYFDDLDMDSLVANLQSMATELRGPLGKMMAALIAESQFDPKFADEFWAQYIAVRRERAMIAVAKAIGAGKIKDRDAHLILDVVYGPMILRLMLGHQPLSPEFVADYVDLILNGLLVEPAQEAPRQRKVAQKRVPGEMVSRRVARRSP